jgi:secreted PhoX family phosphatase
LTVNPDGPRFGANCDYVAYFGEGWNNDWGMGGQVIDGTGSAPQWNGSGEAAWMWVNHEYVSNNVATTTSAPDGQYLTLARFMRNHGAFTHDVTSNTWTQFQVNQFNYAVRRELGGSWIRVEKDPYTGRWNVDRKADNKRYDSTSNTLLRITGYNMASADHDDHGNVLPSGIVVGIQSDCSGGQTPWGTVFTAEENVQFQYGNLENCWTSNQQFTHGTTGDYAPGANVTPNFATDTTQLFGLHSDPNKHHAKDAYGFIVEMDPGEFPSLWYESTNAGGDGRGHRKMGNFGRARWENVATAVNTQWRLTPGQPIVLYSGDDTRSGRIYKFVSSQNYNIGMNRAEIRALLDSGSTYVAHFGNLDNDTGTTVGGNNPGLASGTFGQGNEVGEGQGQWILMSTSNGNQSAPNAQAPVPSGHSILDPGNTGTVTLPDMTVGQALQDVDYNGIGGFPNNNLVYAALFTASCKIGVMELNRPEDLEWDPINQILYIAFTNHNRRTALDDNGVLRDPATHGASTSRADTTGTIFGLIESDRNNPAASATFTFWSAWQGTNGAGPHDTSCPDNIMLDKTGGVWFGTDGNFGVNGTADAVYYLAINGTGAGTAWRVMAGPSDSEFTGPCFSSDLRTLFGAVQHPGESESSVWPPR